MTFIMSTHSSIDDAGEKETDVIHCCRFSTVSRSHKLLLEKKRKIFIDDTDCFPVKELFYHCCYKNSFNYN